MQNRDSYDKILNLFLSENLSITTFIRDLLRFYNVFAPQYPVLLEDLLANAHLLVGDFALHKQSASSVRIWVHNYACGIYAQDIQHLSRKDIGLHFNARKAQSHSIIGFNTKALVSLLSQAGPYIWELATRIVGGLGFLSAAGDRKDHSDAQQIKALSLVAQMLYANNQNCNLVASIIGIFLHTCNAPERVRDALCQMNVSISSSSIDNAINHLSLEAASSVRAAGQTLLYGYMIDNFDILQRHSTTTVEQNSRSTLVHLMSGSLIKLVHTNPSDLKYSSYLWERSRYNDKREIPMPTRSIRDLFQIHPDKDESSGLNRRERFIAWLFTVTLCTHGPQYFKQFLDQIEDPEAIDKIPPVKSFQVPARSMRYNNSTVDGNIRAIEDILKQGGAFDIETLEKLGINNADDFVIFIHGDLGTGERIHLARVRRSIERTARRRLQYVIFIPGIFHIKMACADAIWRIFIKPANGRTDSSSFFAFLSILYPNDSSRIASGKASFQMLDDCIVRVGNADRLECWRTYVQSIWSDCDTLDKYAQHKPTLQELTSFSIHLASKYSSSSIFHENARGKPEAERDTELENVLIRLDYFFLYEELAYSIRSGDVGRIETCLRRWIPIFRGCGKHKYANMLLEFLLDVHFVFPEPLRKAVRYNWLCNPKGVPMGFRGVDWLLELNNLLTKVIYGGRSSNYTVDRVIQESILIELYRNTKKVVETQFFISPKTLRHADPDMTATYKALSRKAIEAAILTPSPSRKSGHAIRDTFSDGLDRMFKETGAELHGQEEEEAEINYEVVAGEEEVLAEFE